MDLTEALKLVGLILAPMLTVMVAITSYNKVMGDYIKNFKRRIIDEIFRQMNLVLIKYSLLAPSSKGNWTKIIEELKKQKIISNEVRGLLYEYVNILLVLNYNDRKIFKDVLQLESFRTLIKIRRFWRKVSKKFDFIMEQMEKTNFLSFTKEENKFYKKTAYNPIINNHECIIQNESVSVFPDFDDQKIWDHNINFLEIDNAFNKKEFDSLIRWKKITIGKILDTRNFSLNIKLKKVDVDLDSTLNFDTFAIGNNGQRFYKIETFFHRNHDLFCNCSKMEINKESAQSLLIKDTFKFNKYSTRSGDAELQKMTIQDFANLYNWYIERLMIILKTDKKQILKLMIYKRHFDCKVFNLIARI